MSRFLSMTARRIAAPAAVAATSFLRVSQTFAEEEAADNDPYANLPNEDERTACQICLINRQGPCRPYWRKMEACLKDHSEKQAAKGEEQEHSSAFCDRYMMPWLECVHSYRNMYTLYYNDLYQLEVIEPIEKEIMMDDLYTWEGVDLDWSPYVDWIKSKDLTLWKLFSTRQFRTAQKSPRPVYEGEDPELVELELKVSLQEGGLPIEIAYAKDQGGLVLGVEHFSAAKKNDLDAGVLKFGFRPERTASVQFFALYKDEGEEVRLYCSNVVLLAKVAENAEIPLGGPEVQT
jgi:hypothetical protein